MILGIGNDMVDIRRIKRSIDKFGKRFTSRVFTTSEQQRARKSPNPSATYAKRFAAKEACAKALGTGFQNGVFLKDIGVTNDENGRPILKLTGGALSQLENITPQHHKADVHLSITDDHPWAQAFVIISAQKA